MAEAAITVEDLDDGVVDVVLEFEDEVKVVKASVGINGSHREAQTVGGLGFLGVRVLTVPLEDRRMGAEEECGVGGGGRVGEKVERGKREEERRRKRTLSEKKRNEHKVCERRTDARDI